MMRITVLALTVMMLSGCLCLPEGDESVDGNYFDHCWSEAEKGPRNQGIFVKP